MDEIGVSTVNDWKLTPNRVPPIPRARNSAISSEALPYGGFVRRESLNAEIFLIQGLDAPISRCVLRFEMIALIPATGESFLNPTNMSANPAAPAPHENLSVQMARFFLPRTGCDFTQSRF